MSSSAKWRNRVFVLILAIPVSLVGLLIAYILYLDHHFTLAECEDVLSSYLSIDMKISTMEDYNCPTELIDEARNSSS